MSKFDVLIPAFNAAHFLPGAIESVIGQTEQDWHIVIVDDGSTDNTQAVVQPYLSQLGEKISYIYQENKGLPAARNTGIRHTSSQLIALLDADDLWLPNRLADTLPLFEKSSDVGLTFGGITRFREAGIALDTFPGNPVGRNAVRMIYTRKIELPCPSVTFRRSCIDQVGFFDETMRATEDRDLWLRIAQKFQVGVIPTVIAWYRLSNTSMSSDLPRMLRAQKQFIHKHYGEPNCGWFARRIALARIHKQQAEAYVDRRQFSKSLPHALHAVLLAPWKRDNLLTTMSIAKRTLNRDP